jgi:hypothetical protein
MPNIYKTTNLPSGATITELDMTNVIIPVVPVIPTQPTNQQIFDNQTLMLNTLFDMTNA